MVFRENAEDAYAFVCLDTYPLYFPIPVVVKWHGVGWPIPSPQPVGGWGVSGCGGVVFVVTDETPDYISRCFGMFLVISLYRVHHGHI